MNERAIIVRCVIDDTPPSTTPFTIPTLITRYKQFYPNTREAERKRCEVVAERLTDAARNWYHPTDFFYSALAGTRLAHYRKEWIEMATPKGKSREFQSNKPEWKGFIERPLTEAELATLDEWKPKPAELFELVHRLLEDGYNLSLSYSQKLKSATCTLKDENPERKSAGYALSSHDTNGYEALKMAMYKHHACLETDWTSLLGTPPKAKRG